MKRKCPICEKEFEDILKHISIQHNIKNFEELQKKANIYEIIEKRKILFREHIKELNDKLSKKEITPSEFRNLREEWDKQTNREICQKIE